MYYDSQNSSEYLHNCSLKGRERQKYCNFFEDWDNRGIMAEVGPGTIAPQCARAHARTPFTTEYLKRAYRKDKM